MGQSLGWGLKGERGKLEEGVVGSMASAAGRGHALLVTLEEDDRKNKVARVVGLGVSWAEERLRARKERCPFF
jgi:hypothetical protein